MSRTENKAPVLYDTADLSGKVAAARVRLTRAVSFETDEICKTSFSLVGRQFPSNGEVLQFKISSLCRHAQIMDKKRQSGV